MDAQEAPAGSKRHARIKGMVLPRPLSVDEEEDWRVILEHADKLVCPQDYCKERLKVVGEDGSARRHLLTVKGTAEKQACEHWGAWRDEEEPDKDMSDQHRWYRAHVAAVCRAIGANALVEPLNTHADVLVEYPKTALEVQRSMTDFEKRERDRANRGAETIWLVPEDQLKKSPELKTAMFKRRAVGLICVRKGTGERCAPWEPGSPFSDDDILVKVGYTVYRGMDEEPYLETRPMTLEHFLREVLRGDRTWVANDDAMPKNEDAGGLARGWVHRSALKAARAKTEEEETTPAAPAEAKAEAEPPAAQKPKGIAPSRAAAQPVRQVPYPVPREPAPVWTPPQQHWAPPRPAPQAWTGGATSSGSGAWKYWAVAAGVVVLVLLFGCCVFASVLGTLDAPDPGPRRPAWTTTRTPAQDPDEGEPAYRR